MISTARVVRAPADRALRILAAATFVSRVGRGVFVTVTVLYFSLVVGLAPQEVALIMAAAGAAGVLSSLAGGWFADRVSSRWLALALTALTGVALICYVGATDFTVALVIAVIVGAGEQAANSTRMTMIARGFEGDRRVHARAVLRTVTNLGIAAGSGVAALALLDGSGDAYRWLIAGAGLMYVIGSGLFLRLPARVDAPARRAHARAGSRAAAITSVDASTRSRPAGVPGRSPWRDPRFLALTATCAVFGMHFGVAEVGVPLWIATDTDAPDVLVSMAIVANTVIVVLFQVRLSRGTHDPRRAGRAAARAAWLMAAACIVYAAAAGASPAAAILIVLVAAITHAFAEVLSQAGGWALCFELADHARPGMYQGVFAMGVAVGAMLAPIVVTATALGLGLLGWAILGAVFLAAGLGTWAVARCARQDASA
jgi:predicted MFS family arabinose efflux permease